MLRPQEGRAPAPQPSPAGVRTGGDRRVAPGLPGCPPHEAPRPPGRVLVFCTVTPRPDAGRQSLCLGKGAGRRVFPLTGPKGPAPGTSFGEVHFPLEALPRAVGPQRLRWFPVSFPWRADRGEEGRETPAPAAPSFQASGRRGRRHLLPSSRLRPPRLCSHQAWPLFLLLCPGGTSC